MDKRLSTVPTATADTDTSEAPAVLTCAEIRIETTLMTSSFGIILQPSNRSLRSVLPQRSAAQPLCATLTAPPPLRILRILTAQRRCAYCIKRDSTVAKQHRCNAAFKPLCHELNGAEPSTGVHRFGITVAIAIGRFVQWRPWRCRLENSRWEMAVVHQEVEDVDVAVHLPSVASIRREQCARMAVAATAEAVAVQCEAPQPYSRIAA